MHALARSPLTDALMHAMSRSPFADARMQALASTGDGTPPGCQKNEKNETALEGGPEVWFLPVFSPFFGGK